MEEDLSYIQKICTIAKTVTPDYDTEKIYSELLNEATPNHTT